MPPKTVTCSVCSQSVLKAQTLARADGARACRSHEGVQAEAEQLAQADRERIAKTIAKGSLPEQWASQRRAEEAGLISNWEKEAAEHRKYIYSHCWTCASEGLEWGEFWTEAMIASKRLQLRGEWRIDTFGVESRKLMGDIRLLVPIKLESEVVDKAVIKHVYHKIRQAVPLLGFILICPECCKKHGFGKRFEALMPKPTWEQIESMSVVTAIIDPLVTAMAEKKERQS